MTSQPVSGPPETPDASGTTATGLLPKIPGMSDAPDVPPADQPPSDQAVSEQPPAEQPPSDAATGPVASPRRRRPSRRSLAVGGSLLLVAALGAGSTAYVQSNTAHDRIASVLSPAGTRHTAVAAVAPVATLGGMSPAGTVPWQDPLTVSVTDGTLTSVTGIGPDGTAIDGVIGPDGGWTSTTDLVPAVTYSLTALVRDAVGTARILPLSARTKPPTKTLSVRILPGDDAVVGVGQAISVRLGTPVKDEAARAELEKRLTVTTSPAVVGAWRWMSSTELRYRGADLWPAGTKITVTAAVNHLQAAPGVWGNATRVSTFTVGDALTSVVDTQAHTMIVSKNGQVLRVMKASMGKPQFATRNGTFVVLEKFADRVMDSATVDLPPGTPAYKTAVKDAVRITNSGTFTHGAPWSVRSQGVVNVSHGCINLSPADAHWYFLQVKRGDVVTVVNSTTGPSLSDAGSQDWNMSFAQWKSGSALA